VLWKKVKSKFWSFLWFFLVPALLAMAAEFLIVDLEVVDEMAPWRIILFLAAAAFVLLSVKSYLPFWSDPVLEEQRTRRRLRKEASGLRRRIDRYLPGLKRRISYLSRQVEDGRADGSQLKYQKEGLAKSRKLEKELRKAREQVEGLLEREDSEEDIQKLLGRLRSAGVPSRVLPSPDSTFELVKIFGTAIVLAFLLRAIVVEPFRIPSASMVPTLQIGDHIFVNKYVYGVKVPYVMKGKIGVRPPGRGEVAVFQFPNNRDKDFIKRVVGLPGDEVEIRAGVLHINDQEVPRCKVQEIEYEDRDPDTMKWEKDSGVLFLEHLGDSYYTIMQNPYVYPTSWGPETVPEGKVFVMGDNRDHSYDSRSWGGVPFDLIKGKAFLIWWSNGPRSHPLRFDRMGHMLGADPIMPKEFGPLLDPCLAKLRDREAPPER
jgi:signal peptidase I